MAGGGAAGGAAPTNTGQQGQATSLGFAPAPIGSVAGGNGVGFGGGMGSGAMGFADYDPNSTASGLFGRGNNGAQPAPGQMNWQVSDAQKANLLAQQQMRDQMVRQQAAPQQMQQQRAMSPLMQQQMMRQQQPMFNPMQQMMMRQQQPMFNPMQQQFRPQQQFQQQQQMSGLQAALMQMMGRQNQPIMRAPMPQYGRSAQMNPLAFRPDTTQAQESLSRVKPSVQKQEQDAQAARIAELEAQLAGFNRPSNDYGGG
jgi:hypothetical protein